MAAMCARKPAHAPEVVARIVALALEHPAYGCNRLEALLALEGRYLRSRSKRS
jgi:hypothetical protein